MIKDDGTVIHFNNPKGKNSVILCFRFFADKSMLLHVSLFNFYIPFTCMCMFWPKKKNQGSHNGKKCHSTELNITSFLFSLSVSDGSCGTSTSSSRTLA